MQLRLVLVVVTAGIVFAADRAGRLGAGAAGVSGDLRGQTGDSGNSARMDLVQAI